MLRDLVEKGPFMVAEIGANHDGSPEKAHRLIDEMADAGADAAKFQLYTAAQLVADYDRLVRWGRPGRQQQERVGEMFDRIALPRDAYPEVFAHCRERGLEPFATVFDPVDLDFVLNLGQRLCKVSSGDVNYKNLLAAIAETGLPVLISGGKCTLGELVRAVEVLEQGGGDICVMHCVAAYPAPVDEANLRVLQGYAVQFPEAVLGFSDHTEGVICALGAVALGALVIEKHVTYDQQAMGPDHWFSATGPEFAMLAVQCRALYKALGTSRKKILACEATGAKFGRRSIVAARDLPAGHRINAADLAYLRPGTGIDPFDEGLVVGAVCKCDIKRNSLLSYETLEFLGGDQAFNNGK
jgi:sialic acid synthase SpsE